MKKTAFIIVILTLFTNCKSELIIQVKTQETNEKKVKAIITTNFPENTILSITAERIYQRKNDSNLYGGTHYYSRELAVKNGEIEFSFNVDDKKWIKNYNEYKKFEKGLNEIDFKSIKDSIEITIFYTPEFERDKNVAKILGKRGGNINGKGTFIFDDYKGFRKTIKIFSKFKR